MGLNDTICKNKAGYCTKKNVFLNGEQISCKMCRVKKYKEETNTYIPCSHFIDKTNKRFAKIEEKINNSKTIKVSKKRIENRIVKVNGDEIIKTMPICLKQKEYKPKNGAYINKKKDYKCTYTQEYISSNLCDKRGCKKGTYGKIEEIECPYLVSLLPKKKKQKKRIKTNEIEKNDILEKVVYSTTTKDVSFEQLNDNELILFGKKFKKDEIL